MVKIAVDAMGGDYAPLEIVRGAEEASAEMAGEVVLVGDETIIAPLLQPRSRLEIVHTPIFVEMHESPSTVLRRKTDSSLNKAFKLLKSGSVQAVVTAGNSGAAMAFAIFTVGRIKSVERPAILTIHPNTRGTVSCLLDAGGNVDCKPSHLVQFGLMGHIFAKHALGIDSPRVGLLSNGQEEKKGNELTRESHHLLKGLKLNYVGYIEGTDLYNGMADVVVTDGFVGNVALKVSEGVAEAVVSFLKERMGGWNARRKMGYLLLSDVFKALSRMVDYSEVGGAPLLGIDGPCIICHGKSKARAIKNAILRTEEYIGKNISGHIKDAMQAQAAVRRTKER
jgi:phosphate acyltransferase